MVTVTMLTTVIINIVMITVFIVTVAKVFLNIFFCNYGVFKSVKYVFAIIKQMLAEHGH